MQNKAQLIKELSQYTKEDIIEAIADTDEILANRIITKLKQSRDLLVNCIMTNLKTSDDQLETIIKFLRLPKESQEKILINLSITAQKVFSWLQQELGNDAVIKALEAKKRAKNTPNT